ncbi:HlyD family efflux transporter periplasmic adaptor subunit [Ancylobacter dichloromethanicus]|uniref:HlyD family secretion protein n=1 Tax=Ancylobacter dichloromethanicus TaxID=518825 RepID=UPI001BCB5173|nr:HlyD family efflux transporter periplasmic adaptor subunit [Ancylobacter dichloromethanicus]MBS7552398.1 HlyD family efflux transporter periplasmic adaptor subunit [Ancylobacter dichloromethanicus]
MTPRFRLPTNIVVVILTLVLFALAAIFVVSAPGGYQGYAEAEFIFVGPDEAGRIVDLKVDEGDRVTKGMPLFTIDEDLQVADVKSAEASLGQALSQLANVKASAQRPEQVAVLEAGERRAAAALELSRLELERQKDLQSKQVASQAALDVAQQTYNQNEASLDQARREIEAARLAGRDDEIAAAEKAVDAARAALAAAQVRLDRRRMSAPVSGTVETIYFRTGELVPAGRPVVSILPPELIKVRFFVPEPSLPKFQLGTAVVVSCDGCEEDIEASVSFIAASAEYTPPVIYSLEERSKLVFMLEARPRDPSRLRPGQPVTVEIAP